MQSQSEFGNDILDVRDIQEERDAIWDDTSDQDPEDALNYLRKCKELEDQGLDLSGPYADNILIHDDYFTEYAEQLADDIGAIDGNQGWPCNHIDWEAAADELKIDYSEYDINGDTYFSRN